MMKPHDIQILFADLQPEILARSKTNPPEALAASAAVLAKIATILDVPMLFSVVPEGGKAPELIPELKPHATEANSFPRMSADPFRDEATVSALAATRRNTLVIAGFANEVVTLHATLSAIESGYAVQVPIDASGGMSERSEAAALRQIERAGGIITSVSTLATMLLPDFSSPPGADAFEALQALRRG
ncbi:isochorismatase family protein [Sphingomonas oryzagri]